MSVFFSFECCYGPDGRYIDGGLRHASSGTEPSSHKFQSLKRNESRPVPGSLQPKHNTYVGILLQEDTEAATSVQCFGFFVRLWKLYMKAKKIRFGSIRLRKIQRFSGVTGWAIRRVLIDVQTLLSVPYLVWEPMVNLSSQTLSSRSTVLDPRN